MSEEKMRAEFEAAFPAVVGGITESDARTLAFDVWQAASASKQREIAELSALVEVMREVIKLAWHENIPEGMSLDDIMDKASEAIDIIPSAALRAHDNEVAAKALEEVATTEFVYGVRDRLLQIATERRNRK